MYKTTKNTKRRDKRHVGPVAEKAKKKNINDERNGPGAKQIIPASDPNGRFVTSLGFSSVRTSWAFRPLGLLGLFLC